LSKNYITEDSGDKIGEMLELNVYLEELQLHWNQLQSEGAKPILQGIMKNNNIRVFDISWNNIGNNKDVTELICRAIKEK